MDRLQQVIDEAARLMPDFSVRDEQHTMMKHVYDMMITGKKGAIHAPTGTGKTLGYLLPYLAVKLDDPTYRIVINTHTINLQEQLERDMPLVNSIFQSLTSAVKPLIVNVLKGKTNYFCEQRFHEAASTLPHSLLEDVSNRLYTLKKESQTLDRQSFNLSMRNEQWNELQVENCKGEACSFHRSCSFYKSHFSDYEDIVITNHVMFFKRHLYVENAWNDYSFFIFDESHKLEKVMLSASTLSLSASQVENWVLHGAKMSFRHGLNQEHVNNWITSYLYQNPIINAFKRGLSMLSEQMGRYAIDFSKLDFNKENVLKMLVALESWQNEMFDTYKRDIAGYDSEEEVKKELMEDVNFWGAQLMELRAFIHAFQDEEHVFWLDKEYEMSFQLTPKSLLHIPTPFTKGVLFTSGTLVEEESTNAFTNRLGVNSEVDLVLPTPFDLRKNTLVFASPRTNPKNSRYEQDLERDIMKLLAMGELKTFVLFTSKDAMTRMYQKLQSRIVALAQGQPIDVLVQEKSNYHDVIDSFQDLSRRSVLFGTLSYFEGIDLKGKALTQLILTRLPFSVPDQPVQEILDTHSNYSRWEAMVRFEQAFGRLIRTVDDYGTFSVLDSRIYQFRYFFELFEKEGIPTTNIIEEIGDYYVKRAGK